MLPPFNGRTSCFFLELWVFPSIIFEGRSIYEFSREWIQSMCFLRIMLLFFSIGTWVSTKWAETKKSTNLGSTLHPGCHKFLYLRRISMRMEKVPSKNLLPNGGRLDGDLHPMVKKYKNHQQKANPSFVAPRFFQLNFEKTSKRINQFITPVPSGLLSLVCSTCRWGSPCALATS